MKKSSTLRPFIYNDYMNWIPKTGLLISATTLTGLSLIALIFNDSWICDGRGFMGSSSTCVEVLLSSYLGLTLIFLIIIFGIWTTITYTTNALKSKLVKKTKAKR